MPIEEKMILSKSRPFGLVGFGSVVCAGTLISLTPLLQQSCWSTFSRSLLLANGAFACACGASAIYLIQEHQLKRKRFLTVFQHLPALERLDTLCHQGVITGLSLSVLGLLTVFRWHDNYHNDWSHQVSDMCGVCLLYLFQLFIRFVLRRRGRKPAYFSITCFSILLFCTRLPSGKGNESFLTPQTT